MSNLRAALIASTFLFVATGFIENWSVATLVGGVSFIYFLAVPYSRGVLS